jgi:hypothetical protein
MPLKPIKYGFKVFIAAESEGYVMSYEPYTSLKSENNEKYKNSYIAGLNLRLSAHLKN